MIRRLLKGEWVTETTDWYELHDAHVQVMPYNPNLEVCVASTFSPNGGTLAAKGGIRPADRFEYEFEDPVLKRTIRHAYDVMVLPVLG